MQPMYPQGGAPPPGYPPPQGYAQPQGYSYGQPVAYGQQPAPYAAPVYGAQPGAAPPPTRREWRGGLFGCCRYGLASGGALRTPTRARARAT